jgi:ribosomal protein S18 acetylase RimI-like enzyme
MSFGIVRSKNKKRQEIGLLLVRRASRRDDKAIWRIMEPIIRAGETYPLASDMSEADALDYWYGPDDEIFVVEEGDEILGTYHLRPNCAGGGSHIANVGYMTSSTATGKGVGRRMVEHSLQQAREKGFKAIQFNFVVSTNERAIRLYKDFGFDTIGTVPLAFLHPKQGYVDVLVMFKSL